MDHQQSLRDALEAALTNAAARLRDSDLPDDLADALDRLARQVREPFVLAVVGMVKAGKSSLVNTLLGQDLAKVGATETTATVNWFRHGRPDLDRPVRCYRLGRSEPESHPRSFLDRLQGDDEETLRLGGDIERIEYLVDDDWLRSVILVDTPGLGAASAEHQDRTAEFIRLDAMLRERHHRETIRLAQEADAILYVQPPPLRASDRTFLEGFQGLLRQGASPFNAVVVIGKFDSFDEDLERGQERAATLARKIGPLVNAVMPVSAGVHRLVLRYRRDPAQLDDFTRFVRETPDDLFSAMTDSPDGFVQLGDSPPGPERKLELVGETPWASFRAAAIHARRHRDRDAAAWLDDLERLAGIVELRAMIGRTFLARGPMLRCYRIVRDAESLLEDGGYEYFEQCRKMDAAARAAGERFLALLRRLAPAALPQDRGTVDELAAFVTRHATQTCRSERVRAMLAEIMPRFAELRRSLESWGDDLSSLQTLGDSRPLFSDEEAEELEAVFGKNGVELRDRIGEARDAPAYIRSRQLYWHEASRKETNEIRRRLSRMASARYEGLLHAARARDETPARSGESPAKSIGRS